jgi:hypothetical protein
MGEHLTTVRIVGVALALFSSVLLGVGIHHIVATGTCSSTGYSANYGPVPHCPSGTGAWFGFVVGGIIGALIGSMMASGPGLVFGSIFGGIGFGALTLAFDSHSSSSTQIFAGAFGGSFAVVSVGAWIVLLSSALSELRRPSGAAPSRNKTRVSGGPRSMGVARPVITPTPVPFSTPLAMGMPTRSGSIDSLAKLGELHQQGVLTDAEFTAAKSKLLGSV